MANFPLTPLGHPLECRALPGLVGNGAQQGWDPHFLSQAATVPSPKPDSEHWKATLREVPKEKPRAPLPWGEVALEPD